MKFTDEKCLRSQPAPNPLAAELEAECYALADRLVTEAPRRGYGARGGLYADQAAIILQRATEKTTPVGTKGDDAAIWRAAMYQLRRLLAGLLEYPTADATAAALSAE